MSRLPWSRLASLLAWALVLVVAVWLRFWQLGSQILIDDEWHAVHRLLFADYREIFLSFGHADYSIPLTLLFKWMAETGGLSEWRMRALPLVSGLFAIVALPWIMRPWLRPQTAWLFAGLLAISPLLVHFTRYVRPYAITVTLGFLAVMALWRWWHEGDRRWLLLFVPATVLCAWLHPLTLLFTGGALGWFGVAALWQGVAEGRWHALWRIIPVGLLTSVLCAALVLPPLLADPAAMSGKSGVHQIQLTTLFRAWELVIGSASTVLGLIMLVLTGLGGWVLWQRERGLLAYWLFLTFMALLVVALLNAAWVHHALVPVRYSAIAVPMILLLVALGVGQLVDWLEKGRAREPIMIYGIGGMLMGMLFVLGPLATSYQGTNQFTNHLRYQLDYDFARNPYGPRMAEARLPAFYDELLELSEDLLLVETPWHFESHFSPLSEFQRLHQRRLRIGMIGGLCTDWTYGEIKRSPDQRFRFRQFVFLDSLLAQGPSGPTAVVLHVVSPLKEIRDLPNIDECVEAFRQQWGSPWYEDERTVVFVSAY